MNDKATNFILLAVFLISCNSSTDTEDLTLNAEAIRYSTDTLVVLNSQTLSTNRPILTPINADVTSYQLSSKQNEGISIDFKTGIISVSSNSKEGSYLIDLELQNKNGSFFFTNVLTVLRRKIQFGNDIEPMFNINCTPCHIFGTDGNWLLYDEAKNNIDTIILRTITNADMPPSAPLEQSEKDLILQWKIDGLLEGS